MTRRKRKRGRTTRVTRGREELTATAGGGRRLPDGVAVGAGLRAGRLDKLLICVYFVYLPYIYIYIYCMYTYIYIYIYMHIHNVYIYIYTYTLYTYVYIYIYRERERD